MKKRLYFIVMLSLFGISFLMMILSKVEPILLAVAFGVIIVPLVMLTILAIKSYRQTSQDLKNAAFEELLEAEESDDEFEDVEIISQKKKKTRNDKLGYVVICIVATIVCGFMFITLL